MNKNVDNFIIFRTDRLGDFIIHSRPIFELKRRYPKSYITVVCSRTNKKIISNYSFVDEVIEHNKDDNFFVKIKNFLKIIKKNYNASFILDGKKFSYFCNMFIRSKKKVGSVYSKKIDIFKVQIKITSPIFFYNLLFFSKYEIFTSKSSLIKSENFCQKYINLFNELDIKKITTQSSYIFENKINVNKIYKKMISDINYKNFMIIHLDEKWNDVDKIDENLVLFLKNLQINSNQKIIVTAYNNNFRYFRNLKKFFPYFNYLEDPNLGELKNYKSSNIIIIDNLEIYLFENFLKNSVCNISCHSGFVTQVSGANNVKVIDLINELDFVWYNCWKPLNTPHYFVYKSNEYNKITLNDLSKKIAKIVNVI